MQTVSYILRTSKGTPISTYDRLDRAQQDKVLKESRIKAPLKLFKQTCSEEEITNEKEPV